MLKKMMMVLLIGVLMASTAAATILFEEDFTDSVAAEARFDISNNLSWFSAHSFHDGILTVQEWSGGTVGVRTNAANNFVDDGLGGPVVYSVLMDRQDGYSGSVFNSMYARLGASGYGSGYQLRYFCDSTATGSYFYGSIDLFRVVGGAKTAIYSYPFNINNANEPGQPFAAMEVSLTLENTATSVDWALEFGSVSASGSDTDAARVTSGVGVGVELMSSGGAYVVPTDYDNLKVEVVPEPATVTLLVMGGLALLRRKR